MKREWQPMKTAPKDGTNFLAAQAGNGSANDTPWWVLFWNGAAFECVSSGKIIPTATKIVGGATDWQQLPDPPGLTDYSLTKPDDTWGFRHHEP